MTEIRLIGSLQLAIQEVQYCHAGEQETHWDKTTKDQRALNKFLYLSCPSTSPCSPVWWFCTT